MLSDEEKKAINDLNFIIVTDVYDNEVRIDKTKTINEYNESVGIVLNLIVKQSKEIEGLIKVSKECIEEKFNNDKKWEDKIKAKIEEYDKFQKEMTFKNHNADNINDCYRYGDKAQKALYQKEALQSLLEEKE